MDHMERKRRRERERRAEITDAIDNLAETMIQLDPQVNTTIITNTQEGIGSSTGTGTGEQHGDCNNAGAGSTQTNELVSSSPTNDTSTGTSHNTAAGIQRTLNRTDVIISARDMLVRQDNSIRRLEEALRHARAGSSAVTAHPPHTTTTTTTASSIETDTIQVNCLQGNTNSKKSICMVDFEEPGLDFSIHANMYELQQSQKQNLIPYTYLATPLQIQNNFTIDNDACLGVLAAVSFDVIVDADSNRAPGLFARDSLIHALKVFDTLLLTATHQHQHQHSKEQYIMILLLVVPRRRL
mmetsp:Transcript_3657/g.5576  ORF Transcript_3657/g.5576 Transcript_3657/m.5576 type:complete len:297 (-) Transcript_3657:65-955(-)